MIERPSNVRLAVPSDEDMLFKILSEGLFHENGTFSLSESKSRAFIRNAVNNEGGIIGIIEEGNQIAATIGMNLGTFWYSNDFHIEEYWNYTRPEYRKSINTDFKRSDYAKDLINFGKWCSEAMGLILNIGIISTTRTEAKCRLYSRTLTPVGQFFMHNLQVAKGPAIIKGSM